MASTSDHVGKKPKKPKKNKFKDAELNLELIQDLGGTKADLELLKEIESHDDVAEYMAPKEDFEVEPVNREQLESFMEMLDIAKYRPSIKVKEEGDGKVEESDKGDEADADDENDEDDEDDDIPEVTKKAEIPIDKPKKNKNKFKQDRIQDNEISSTSNSPQPATADTSFIDSYVPRKYLIVKPGGQWMDHISQNEPKVWDPASPETVRKFQNYAARLLYDDTALYRKQQDTKKSSQSGWIRTVLSSGTSTDKLAALTLVIQESPVHGLSGLDNLISMVTKKTQRMTLQTIDRLKELFMSDLLPEDRKLKTFLQHAHLNLDDISSGNKDTRDKALLLWYYEEQLKNKYSSFIKALLTVAQDTVQATKKKALDCAFELLSSRPEQEKVLLTFLVNKLGDPDYKVASRCSHLLIKLVDQHPNMKQVVVIEVERLMYRPNMKAKAQYYAVCFLNQLMLSPKENQLASRLLSIYFSFFKMYVKNRELEGKMLSGLLAGVTRAYPFAKVEQDKLDAQINMMFKVLHSLTFNTSLQALMLLLQVSGEGDSISDRFYTALYRKMLDPQLRVSNKQAFFLSLLFKSLKKDLSEKRVKAFIKRLLQVCCQHSPPFTCGALFMLSQLLKERTGLLKFQSVFEDSDDEEHFDDVSDEDEEEKEEKDAEDEPTASSSWVHRTNVPGNKVDRGYDFHQRNPLHSGAEQECIWELERLTQHYHPTVALFAGNILKGETVGYSGDPLQDFTLIRFLDRFVYRNPKAKQSLPGTDSGKKLMSVNKRYQPQGSKAVPVGSEEYMTLSEVDIPVDEQYLYKYFVQTNSRKDKKKSGDDSDHDSEVSDDEFDDYLQTFEKGLMKESGIDFAADFGKKKDKKKDKKKKKNQEESDDEDDDDDMGEVDDDFDNLSEEEVEFSEDEDFKAMMGDGDEGSFGDPEDPEEQTAFSDDDFNDVDFANPKAGKKRKSDLGGDFAFADRPSKKGRKGKDGDSLFAAAEEFSNLIDKNMGAKFDTIGSDAVSNKDNASVKQLKWEADRARKFEGKDWKSIRGKRKNFKNKGFKKGKKK